MPSTNTLDRPDLRWDHLSLDDVDALTALKRSIRRDFAGDLEITPQDTHELLSNPESDLGRDSVAVRTAESEAGPGELIAYGLVHMAKEPDSEGLVRCYLIGGVHPDHRRAGIGSALMDWLEARGLEMRAEKHPGRSFSLQVGGGEDAPEGQDPMLPGGGRTVRYLLDARGFARLRSWIEMDQKLPASIEATAHTADSEDIRIIPLDENLCEPVRQAHAAAFQDHWGSTPPSEEMWKRWWGSHRFRAALGSAAVDPTGTVLSYAMVEEMAPTTASLELVGTRSEARGRGLARAVIARTLQAAAEAGYQRIELIVDSESLTGAPRLYEALGFRAVLVHATYGKRIEQQ